MSDPLRRRDFLRRFGRASAGTVCAAALLPLAACTGVPYVRAAREGSRLRVPLDAFGEGDALLVEHPADDRPIFLHRSPGGGYTAVSTRCAHRGCEVGREGPRLVCPCHGSEYRLDGDLLAGPADRPLHRFTTEAREDAVLITLDRG